MIDLLVVFSPCGGGHKSAALAVDEAARRRGLRSEVIDLFDLAPSWVTRPYLFAHYEGQGRAPDLYGAGYHASDVRGGPLEPVRLGIDRVLFARLRQRVREMNPRAIVATHHLPLVVLGRERRKRRLSAEVTGVVTDYAAHACWAERGVDRFCVPSFRSALDLERHRIDRSKIELTGIPIRRAFERIPSVRVDRGERLRVLVTSGGFGVGPLDRIVKSFDGTDIELTVVCGASNDLEARVRAMNPHARVIGFERDMPSRIAEAHVVIGKAGGLTVSETLTAGRPMIIAGAIPGNEKLNEQFVIGGGAGLGCAPEHAAMAARWLRDSDLVEKMGARARALVVHDAADRVLARTRVAKAA